MLPYTVTWETWRTMTADLLRLHLENNSLKEEIRKLEEANEGKTTEGTSGGTSDSSNR